MTHAGLTSGLGLSPYSASKFAVVNISEGLAKQVAPLGIGVTVLCPGFVRTRISGSGRNRPERYGLRTCRTQRARRASWRPSTPNSGSWDSALMDVAAQVLTAIRENKLYVFTHAGAEWRAALKERFDAILTAIDEVATRHGILSNGWVARTTHTATVADRSTSTLGSRRWRRSASIPASAIR